MTKNFNDVVRGENGAAEELCQKIKNIAHSRVLRRSSRAPAAPSGRSAAGSAASSVNRLAGGEKIHVVPPSSQDEALSRYSVSGEVPR